MMNEDYDRALANLRLAEARYRTQEVLLESSRIKLLIAQRWVDKIEREHASTTLAQIGGTK